MSKAFFGNPVLRDVSIELVPGRIHALLGENGAGKSTLINILSGALPPDGGTVEAEGRPIASLSPRDAQALGIAVVQQELSLAPELSIAENIGLGAFPRRFGLIDYRALAARVAEVSRAVGLDDPPDLAVDALPLGRRQMVEIAKALFRAPRILILDEPTSSLSAHETATLAGLVRRLAAEGVAILYISHRLDEVLDLCGHVTILKDGVRTADRPLAGIGPAELVRLMVGRDPGDLFPAWQPTAATTAEPAIEVRGLAAGAVRGADLTVRYGEIVGLGGLVGQGQEDFLLGLYGAIPAAAGSARIAGRDGLAPGVPAANAAGMAYVPADRKKEALLLPHAIAFNLMLPTFATGRGLALRDRAGEASRVRGLADLLGIRGDVARPVQALSGGNQQKVALAKWLPLTPSVLLLNDPTRGVDVETKREIYLLLRGFAAQGKAVVLLSSDTAELVHLCDRVAVFLDGRIVAGIDRAELTEEAVVAAAMGVAGASSVAGQA